MLKSWPNPCREVLVCRMAKKASITPVDMDGCCHHAKEYEGIETILVYFGAQTALLKDGNICFRGNRLVVATEVVKGRDVCLVVKVTDTSGEEPK